MRWGPVRVVLLALSVGASTRDELAFVDTLAGPFLTFFHPHPFTSPSACQAATMAHATDPYYTTRAQWASSYGDVTLTGAGASLAYTIAADPATGDSYIAGKCAGTLSVGTLPPLVCAGTADMFIAKIAPNGTAVKAANFGQSTGYDDRFRHLTLAADGQSLFAVGIQFGG